jgi:hypothetical protein
MAAQWLSYLVSFDTMNSEAPPTSRLRWSMARVQCWEPPTCRSEPSYEGGLCVAFISVWATLAQLVERLIRNQQVAGSIPAGGSMKSVI